MLGQEEKFSVNLKLSFWLVSPLSLPSRVNGCPWIQGKPFPQTFDVLLPGYEDQPPNLPCKVLEGKHLSTQFHGCQTHPAGTRALCYLFELRRRFQGCAPMGTAIALGTCLTPDLHVWARERKQAPASPYLTDSPTSPTCTHTCTHMCT